MNMAHHLDTTATIVPGESHMTLAAVSRFLVLCLLLPTAASADDFAGLKLGVGLSFTKDTGDHDRVEDATVDANGIVRVNKTTNSIARVMLEAHYFFSQNENSLRAHGPFVAIQPGSDEVINAIGFGWMVGLRNSADSQRSFNVGIGWAFDPATKTLGDEFVENEPAPLGPDGKPLAVRFMTRSQSGIFGLFSFSWN